MQQSNQFNPTISRSALAVQVELDKMRFKRLRIQAASAADAESQIAAIASAACLAAHTGTGVFHAPELDNMLIVIADSLPSITKCQRRGVLHIMTQCYINGGHTRVVERWIKQVGVDAHHSVVLTAQGNHHPIPDELSAVIAMSGGNLIQLDERQSLLDRAMRLRTIAAGFDHVIMHTHMHDVIPVIALGNQNRPVIFYNHADHRFSLGMPVANVIAELRLWGQKLTRKRRGIGTSEILGIPSLNVSTSAVSDAARSDARRKLGVPDTAIIALTAGSPGKFRPMPNYNYFSFANRALSEIENLYFLLIGPLDQEISRFLNESSIRQRIRIFPASSEFEFQRFLTATDFVIDTFPEGGGMLLMDAVAAGLPILSRRTPASQTDFALSAAEPCECDAALLEQTVRFTESSSLRAERHAYQLECLQAESGLTVFQSRLERIFDTARTQTARPAAAAGRREEAATDLDYMLARERAALNWTPTRNV